MQVTIFTDQCIHKDAISSLREAGFKVISSSEVNLETATDAAIFDYALKNNCFLLTFDKDFGNILRFDVKESFGVAIIYIEDMNKEEIIENTLNFFHKFDDIQLKGKLFLIEKTRIRIWPK